MLQQERPFFSLVGEGILNLALKTQERARFPEFWQNFSERQILWSLCSVVFLALTLKLPIQTSLSLPVCVRSGENCQKFRKTRPQGHTSDLFPSS